MSEDTRPAIVSGVMRGMEQQDAKTAAEAIVEFRSRG
jgi:hypothetical protein